MQVLKTIFLQLNNCENVQLVKQNMTYNHHQLLLTYSSDILLFVL